MDVTEVASDLIAEQEALDAVVANLTDEQWVSPTPSPRWSVADQIGHLTYFDATAALAVNDPEGFRQSMADMMSATGDVTPEDADNATLGEYRAMSSADLLAAWRTNRQVLADAAATLENDTRVEWYGPSMGSKSFLTARLMECWAHGQHICDAVGGTRQPTDRLRHIAQLGFITRGWTYINRKMEIPDGDVRVELIAPSGATWRWGPDDAASSVSGDALDFCQVVTQCRNATATNLTIVGDAAQDWMSMAQAFAGTPTDSPAP